MSVCDKYFASSVPASMCYDYVINKHYAHRKPQIKYAFGLFRREDKELCGVCTFGKPLSSTLINNSMGGAYSKVFYELNRLCVDEGLEKNVLSFFVSSCLNMLPKPMVIVSFADTSMCHHGYIYQATNWIYTGLSAPFKDYMVKGFEYLHHTSVMDMVGRSDGKKGHLDKVKLLKEKFGEENVYMIDRPRKHRYFYFLGSKTERKKMMKALAYPILPYPKGDNKRYDASYQPAKEQLLF